MNSFKKNSTSTLFETLLSARSNTPAHLKIIEDNDKKSISYNEFITRCFILGDVISAETKMQEHVGILLPNVIATTISFFALQAYGRIPTMLNYTTHFKNIRLGCEATLVKTIYTSRAFIEKAELQKLESQMIAAGFQLRYLEDVRKNIGFLQKIKGAWKAKFAKKFYARIREKIQPEDTAVILFTSGSEGLPKGVALSHKNILSNCYQMTQCIDFNSNDVLFNALPIFHCFGLTVGTVLPLLLGIRAFYYPSPLHYRSIPPLLAETEATLFFSTDTFLTGYAHYAKPEDFKTIRYIFAGAEKLKESTRLFWKEKFGVTVFQGYGVTETSPVIAVNTPQNHKPDSVGKLVPEMQYRIEPVEGISEGGRLFLKGPNVMQGYFSTENPGKLIETKNGWHDTGDIVKIDEEGFITILGRRKRFAKIAGEMISLPEIETAVSELWPENLHAVLNVPDTQKGEKLILITDRSDAKKEMLAAYLKSQGFRELWIPKEIHVSSEIPVLATGKIDYVQLQTQWKK